MAFVDVLGDLAKSHTPFKDSDVSSFDAETLEWFFKMMVRIRLVEECIAELVSTKKAHCPCHLSIGQEAVATGISRYLNAQDKIFGAHRSHGHYLALEAGIYPLLAEILGKATGCAKGMGGSMHIVDRSKGFVGSVPIVAGTIPLALGAAIAAKMDGSSNIAVSYLGDGACEEGIFHESLNMASVMEVPLLFVVENNLFSSHLDIHLRQPSNTTERFAKAHHIKSMLVDGNDVCEVARAAKELIQYARETRKPVFLEAVTYRWLGHVGADANIDVGLNRKKEDVEAWKKKDPIQRLEKAILKAGIMNQTKIQKIVEQEEETISAALARAMEDPFPPQGFTEQFVYKRP